MNFQLIVVGSLRSRRRRVSWRSRFRPWRGWRSRILGRRRCRARLGRCRRHSRRGIRRRCGRFIVLRAATGQQNRSGAQGDQDSHGSLLLVAIASARDHVRSVVRRGAATSRECRRSILESTTVAEKMSMIRQRLTATITRYETLTARRREGSGCALAREENEKIEAITR